MIGYDREDLEAGRINWDVLTPTEWLPWHLKAMADLKNTGRTPPHERQYQRKDGSRSGALFAAWRLTESETVVYVIPVSPDRFHPAASLPHAE
jgi:PAS domain-containing protein